jgi:hypothetical protein
MTENQFQSDSLKNLERTKSFHLLIRREKENILNEKSKVSD